MADGAGILALPRPLASATFDCGNPEDKISSSIIDGSASAVKQHRGARNRNRTCPGVGPGFATCNRGLPTDGLSRPSERDYQHPIQIGDRPVIPRNLAVTVAILCSLTLGMSLYLWQLRHREAANGPRVVVPQHVAAPASGQNEKVTMIIARDDTSELRSQSISIPAFTNPQERAEEILRQLLNIYQQKDSSHPLAAAAEIRDVYLIDPGIAVIDMNSALVDGQTSGILAEELTLVSIIQTLAANVPGVIKVKFLVDGKERDTLAGHVDLARIYGTGEVSQLAQQLGPQ